MRLARVVSFPLDERRRDTRQLDVCPALPQPHRSGLIQSAPRTSRGQRRPQLTMYPEKCLIEEVKVHESVFTTPPSNSETTPPVFVSRFASE
jgi:hypothetical protein